MTPATATMLDQGMAATQRAPSCAIALLLGLLVLASQAAHAGAAGCASANVVLKPVAGSNYSVYEGRTPTHRIRFVSERPGERVDAFPEPPVRIIRRATGATCLIRDGGVWAGTGVYAGAGGRRFLLLESSGSGSAITVYDADNCARRAEIDVSEARWRFTEGGVEIGRQCKGTMIEECSDRHVTPLRADCAPGRK